MGIGKPGLELNSNAFDLVIVDEAARSDPGELAIAINRGKKVILVGDHKQLPPMYSSELTIGVAKKLNIPRELVEISDFEECLILSLDTNMV